MGFYDYLTCEAELPERGVPVGAWFQTKDFSCTSSELTITKSGRLVETRFSHEWPDQGNARPGDAAWLPMKRTLLGTCDLEFHGEIRFYDYELDMSYPEYVARFTDGKLTWIKPMLELLERHQTLLKTRFGDR
jgi:hypothetical protein